MDNSILSNCCTRTIILVALLLSLRTPGSRAFDNLEFRPAAVEPRVLELPRDYRAAERRLLGPFQLCLACKCCAAATPTPVCATMPCCFSIDCHLPNKPFGVCAFVPKSCNCASCAV
ncbi:hypothetical protein ACJRO7_007113 [Eucalyptus globulus]|uniref:DUF7866 domain-containing protein n=1 Tax=Eucalyptus globulus TaxID=34317 RepID=A0ABD3IK75_EUCGL